MASIVDTSVKHFYSSMQGTPVLSGTAGSLIALLDACLVTGWGLKAVDSATVSNGVCRLAFASGKSGAELHSVILVSGATPAGLNGEQRVTAVSSSWVEFKTDTPDGPVSGTLSFKMAPLGWEKVFSKTNVAAYRATDVRGTRPFVRIDDSNALYARVALFEVMTDIDTGIAATPPAAMISGGYFWHRRQSAGASAANWVIVGDSQGFYFCPGTRADTTATSLAASAVIPQYCGDINSYRSGDAWCALVSGALTTTYDDVSGDVFQQGHASGRAIARASHGIGSSAAADRLFWNNVSGRDGGLGPFPNRADNGLRLTPIVIADGGAIATVGARGELPGAYHCPQSGVTASIGHTGFVKGVGTFLGRMLMGVHVGAPGGSYQGVGFLDVIGPWRA